jgi:type VI protein secretion system component Hcp
MTQTLPEKGLGFNPARAQGGVHNFDCYLQLGDIKGDVARPGNPQAIEVASFKWGEAAGDDDLSDTGRGQGGRALPTPLILELPVSGASPEFFLACACVTIFKKAVLTQSGTREKALIIEMETVVVGSYEIDAHDGRKDQLSVTSTHHRSRWGICERVTLHFQKLTWEFVKQDHMTEGPFKGGFDFAANKKV